MGRGRKLLWLLGLLAPLPALISCSPASTSESSGIIVVVLPNPASVNVSMPRQFAAFVTNGTANTVTWEVNDTVGGAAATGTITAEGEYFAPSSVPTGGTVTVNAVSNDDPTVVSNVTVTILPPATVQVMPGSIPLAAGAQQPFTATVTGAPSTNVTWEVAAPGSAFGVVGGNAQLGFIDNNGLYTAPGSPPPAAESPCLPTSPIPCVNGQVNIIAVSVPDNTQSGSANISLSFGIGSLSGSYSFSMNGLNFGRAGTFFADGKGNITGGAEDVSSTVSGASGEINFTGTYTVGSDGRGTLTFNDGQAPASFLVVLSSTAQFQIFAYDPSNNVLVQGQGDQVANQILSQQTLAGTYVFDFTDMTPQGGLGISEIGEFTVGAATGALSAGEMDINSGDGPVSDLAFTGSYTVGSNPSPNGRGTAQFKLSNVTRNFIIYIVSRGVVKFVAADGSGLAGQATQQLPNFNPVLAALSGNYVFALSGTGSNNMGTVGMFKALGNGLISAGLLDENDGGVITPSVHFTGSYSVDDTGRWTATLNATNRTYALVFYLSDQYVNVLQEADLGFDTHGILAQQQGIPSVSSDPNAVSDLAAAMLGSYAVSWNLPGGGLTTHELGIGQFNLVANPGDPSGSSDAVNSGTLDISPSVGAAPVAHAITSGLFAIGEDASGNPQGAEITLTTSQGTFSMSCYFASPTQIFTLGILPQNLAFGTIFKQF